MRFLKNIVIGIAVIIMMIGLVGCGSNSTTTTNTQSNKIEQKAEDKKAADKKAADKKAADAKKEEDIKKAKTEIVRILEKMPSQNDPVEKQTWYKPWGVGAYPAESAPYWYAGKKDSNVWLRAKLVHFSGGTDWVFWTKIIFSTEKGNWEYKINNVFAGQSGGGKNTQIVMGGKYETLDVPFKDIQPGFDNLVKGNRPIIRFQGENRIYDYKLDSTDLNHIKTGLYLYEQLKITNGKIDS